MAMEEMTEWGMGTVLWGMLLLTSIVTPCLYEKTLFGMRVSFNKMREIYFFIRILI